MKTPRIKTGFHSPSASSNHRLAASKSKCLLLAFLVIALVRSTAECRTITIQDTESLVEQLSHPDYQQRESAKQQLVELGNQIPVELLARKLIDGSPETCFGLKQVLQGIAADCDEAQLFKILAILKARFNAPASEAQPLLEHWALSRRQSVIDRWRKLGAHVDDTYQQIIGDGTGIQDLFGPAFQPGIGNGLRVEGLSPLEFNARLNNSKKPAEPSPQAKSPTTNKGLSISERIEDVLDNTLDEHVSYVLDGKSSGANFRGTIAVLQSFPVAIALDATWRGSAADLAPGNNARSLPISDIEFDSMTIGPEWAQTLDQPSLRSCALNDCAIADDSQSGSPILPTSLRTLKIRGAADPESMIDYLIAAESKISQISLVNCPLDKRVIAKLQKLSLTSLSLENLDLDKQDFKQLSTFPQLRQLSLNRCRFRKDAYLEFEQTLMGRVRVNFTAKAFLGVRGTSPRAGRGRIIQPFPDTDSLIGIGGLITEVIAGSAADDAGVQSGDIIVALGEQTVNDFSDLRVLIAQYGVGDEVAIKVYRNGAERELKTTLGEPDDMP